MGAEQKPNLGDSWTLPWQRVRDTLSHRKTAHSCCLLDASLMGFLFLETNHVIQRKKKPHSVNSTALNILFPKRLTLRPSDLLNSGLKLSQATLCDMIWFIFLCLYHQCWDVLSRVRLSVGPWTAARQAPLSTGFSRQEPRRGLPFPPPGIFPARGPSPPWDQSFISCVSCVGSGFLTTEPTWEAGIASILN